MAEHRNKLGLGESNVYTVDRAVAFAVPFPRHPPCPSSYPCVIRFKAINLRWPTPRNTSCLDATQCSTPLRAAYVVWKRA